MYALTLLLGTVAFAGTTDVAAGVHVTPSGFAHLGDALAGVLPRELEVTGVSTSFACDAASDPLDFALPALEVGLVADAVLLEPSADGLHVRLDLGLAAEADDVRVTGDCSFLLQDIAFTCEIDVGDPRPLDVVVDLWLDLALTPEGAVDATVRSFTTEIGPLGNPIQGCRRLRDLFDSIAALGLDSADTASTDPMWFTTLVRSFLDPALAEVGESIEGAIEDGLALFPIETEVDLLGAPLSVSLAPSTLTLDASGLFIGLGLDLDAPWDPTCAADGVDDDGQPIAPVPPVPLGGDWPAVGDTAWNEGALGYDAALLLHQDALDDALFTVWRAGLLCLDVGALSPLPLDTDTLGLLFGASFQDLFPENQSASVTLAAPAPPTGTWTDEALVELGLGDLGLRVHSALDARQCLIADTGIDAVATLGAAITGDALALSLDLPTDAWTFTGRTHELLAEGYADDLGDTLPSLLASFLPPDLLPAIPLPAWQGIGLGDLIVQPSPDGVWQGVFLTLDAADVEPLVIEGCSAGCDGGGLPDLTGALGCEGEGCGGCAGDDASCESGCASPGRGVGRVGLVIFTAALAWRRRRR